MSVAYWYAQGKKQNKPPPGVPVLVTAGLYGSWRFEEGSGLTAASEAGLTAPLTLTNDANSTTTGIPTWRAGGGIVMPGGTSQAKRASEASMNATNGVTLTLAFKPTANTGAKAYFQRNGTNLGYALQLNSSGMAVNASLGTGAARTTTKLASYVLNTVYVLCVTLPNDGGNIQVQKDSTSSATTPTPAAIPWQGATTANLLLGYASTSEIYYAALHTRVLTAQEQRNMVAYARDILAKRGIV